VRLQQALLNGFALRENQGGSRGDCRGSRKIQAGVLWFCRPEV